MDFLVVDHATLFPSKCLCGRADGPMVYTGIEWPVIGHVYLCHACIRDMGRAMGGLDKEQRQQIEAELDKALTRVAMLEAEVVEEQSRKVVPLADVLAFVESTFGNATTSAPAHAGRQRSGRAA